MITNLTLPVKIIWSPNLGSCTTGFAHRRKGSFLKIGFIKILHGIHENKKTSSKYSLIMLEIFDVEEPK
tara:strand:+ start:613 stop:819 length:207 start_codon:yes stop_codon:yes gene_type:complete